MAWVAIGTAAFGAIMGAKKQKEEQEAQRTKAIGDAEANRYGSLTGHYNNVGAVTASPLGGAMQGAVAGFSQGQKFNESGIGGAMGKVDNKSAYAGLTDNSTVASNAVAGDNQFGALDANGYLKPRNGSVYDDITKRKMGY